MIPVITSDKCFYETVASIMAACEGDYECLQLEKSTQAMEYLKVEMPELVLINFSDEKIDADFLLNVIKADPWLLNSNIIGISSSPRQLRESEKMRGTNIVALIDEARLKKQLACVLSILFNNRHMLFQRVIGSDLGSNLSASFRLKNDLLEAHVFINLICNYLYNINRLNEELKEKLNFVLHELLVNAIEHGNCGISFQEKSDWLGAGKDIIDLIELQCRNPEVAKRSVILEYSIKESHTRFRIEDEGDGFNWRGSHSEADSVADFELHGRGIKLCCGLTQSFVYNEKGNALEFYFPHCDSHSSVLPALFHDLETVNVNSGDIVFEEGEPSNFLYYLARGNFEVLVDGNRISLLTPDDIFVGEMSFLLNNKRSATVRAVTDGCLIRISKKEFVEGIKEKPHYSLFLARLLAQRLERLNHQHNKHVL